MLYLVVTIAVMDKAKDVAVLVGSLRRDSFNLKLAKALSGIAPASLALDLVQIGDLPFYNLDLEGVEVPPAWTRFRERIKRADAVLFVTPEYNRSVPAVIKNAIDVGSRPYGHSVWAGKPGAIVTGSPGNIGGFGANHHLRQSLVFVNVLALAQPEVYVSGVDKIFDEAGNIAIEGTASFLKSFLVAFESWIRTITKT